MRKESLILGGIVFFAASLAAAGLLPTLAMKAQPGFVAVRNMIDRSTGEGAVGSVWADEESMRAAEAGSPAILHGGQASADGNGAALVPLLGLSERPDPKGLAAQPAFAVAPGDPAPGGGTFDYTYNPWINDRGDVAFGGHVAGEEVVVRLPGGERRVRILSLAGQGDGSDRGEQAPVPEQGGR